MVRQPYSEAVLSTGGRLYPLVPEVSVLRKRGNRRGVKTNEERLGEKGGAFFNGKEGRDDFRKSQWVHEFTDKHLVREEDMIGNRAKSMAAFIYNKILEF